MFLLDDGTVVHSATDLAAAASCELALLRTFDVRLGLIPPLDLPSDAMLERTARLGDRHEERVLAEHLDRYGPWVPTTGRGVAVIERPERSVGTTRAGLEAKHAETLEVLRTGADVVFQAGFFDGRFGGWADFLVREDSTPSDGPGEPDALGGASGPVYAVHDTKLARHAKVTALLQLAAYADQLLMAGLRPAPQVHLVLGDRTTTSHRLADLLPVLRDRQARLQRMLDEHQAGGVPVAWGDPRYRACGRCEVCAPEVEARRDVLLVAGMRTTQRSRLLTAGITTVEDLAASAGPVEGIGGHALDSLRAQARLQAEQDATAPRPDEGSADVSPAAVVHELFAPEVIGALPAPDPGDVFLDFEGDPLWTESGGTDWGLEYLIGLVEAPATPGAAPVFRAFWAHDRAQERQALLDVLEYLARRRAEHPGMHVYHYAPYEKTALLGLAGRHGVGEEAVDDLLRDGVLVDLYATVRASLRTGQRSYSIKKLEPLYMPARTGAVTTAGDSIVEYAEACALRDEGRTIDWERRLQQIADYNTDDCVSTLLLRDWLLEEAARHGVRPAPRPTTLDEELADGGPAPEEDPLVPALLEAAAGLEPRDRRAVAMVAAALGYHWRERKPFWWGHFDRLASPPEEWTDPRGTLLVEQASVVEDWHQRTSRQLPRRHLRLVGRLEPGSELRPGAAAFALYEAPLPAGAKTSTTGTRGWTERITVLDVRTEAGPDGPRDVLLAEDALRREEEPHGHLPMALCPGRPPATTSIEAALRALGERTLAHLREGGQPALPAHPALDLLRRVPPRTTRPLPRPDDAGYVEAILSALRDLDHSYLAVQGPPGTGKTYTGARVIARLVAEGWRIGVVAQSHAVVENLLRGVAEAGVPEHRIGKRPAGTDPAPAPWTWLTKPGHFTAFHDQDGGSVLGGTAWDLTNAGRLPATPLDLLVVDEAGQFSLAGTLAVAEGARTLLLLGDPQQLPQVSQGRHPEPVDRSALGWLTDGHDTLPPELGYFLDRTWRMHPALCAAVSHLAYEGRLGSEPRTEQRSLEGIEPGVRTELVPHQGNAIASTEEAQAVVRLTRDLVGRRWQDPAADVDRPLEPSDVIVVAAYNAQVWTVRQALDAVGLSEVRVGTVDRFQGQQASVVLLTTAASSAEDVPRGMEFLLDRNRINVAISRGQWCAVVVRSPALTDHLPGRPDLLEELGAFLALDQHDRAVLDPWPSRGTPP